jgi:hypothetical protein
VTATARGSRDLAGDVQRFGLFSAATVVDRYAVLVDRVLAAAPPTPHPDERAPTDPVLQAAAPVLVVALRLLESVAALVGAGTPPGVATETLVLPPTAPGGSARTRLWVHNATRSEAPAVDLRVTELVSASGRTLPAPAVSLAPDRLDIPAGSAREVWLAVRVPAGQAPDHYHGLVMTPASPERPLMLRLEVRGG